jgi:hypothetical protein
MAGSIMTTIDNARVAWRLIGRGIPTFRRYDATTVRLQDRTTDAKPAEWIRPVPVHGHGAG